MLRLFLTFFFLCYGLYNTHAQVDSLQVKFDTESLEVQQISDADLIKFKNDPKFDYEIVESNPTWWDDFKTWVGNLLLQFFEWIFGIEEAAGALAAFLRILPYMLLALLLYLLIRFFINVNSSSHTQTNSKSPFVAFSDEEHIIKNENIQVLIQNALNNKDYRLAVRFYYLYILQLMSAQDMIDWQLQKTNHDYEKEIKKPELKNAFSKITRLYDYVWYGDFSIDELAYKKAEVIFLSVRNSLNNE